MTPSGSRLAAAALIACAWTATARADGDARQLHADAQAAESTLREAARRFQRAAAAAADDAARAELTWLAADALQQAHDPDAARAAYIELATKYPHDRRAPDALFAAARADEAIARWDDAIARYAALAALYPQHAHAADALFNAGVLARALGRVDDARHAWSRYLAAYGRRPDGAVVAFEVALLTGSAESLESFAREFRASPRVGEALVAAARAASAVGDTRRADKDLAAAIARWKQLAPGARERDHSGPEAHYLQGDASAALAERIAVAGTSAKRLRAAVDARAHATSSALAILDDVPAYGDPSWSIAASLRAGQLLERFGQAVMAVASRPPAGLSPDEAKLYEKLIESAADPFRDQAIARYRAAYALALATPRYTEAIAARAALVRLGEAVDEREAREALATTAFEPQLVEPTSSP